MRRTRTRLAYDATGPRRGTPYTARMAVPYQPLADFLAAQPPETAAVTLTLAEIAQLLGRPVPASAHTRAWWGNHPSSRRAPAWLAVGWRTQPPQSRQLPVRITFVRAPQTASG